MRIDTVCIHGGYQAKNGEPMVLPIAQSTTFKYDDAQFMGDLFDLKANGHFYTRLSNPTLEAAEKKIAAMEGGVGAMVTSAGQAASMMAVLNLCGAGDHIICTKGVYGGTFNLLGTSLPKLGVSCDFVDPGASEETLHALIRPNTKLIFGEALSNPSLVVLDIEKFARAAHEAGIPLIVDNTFPTPYNCRPFDFGADIVVHSTSKYLDGHATALGGVIVDSGNFDWTQNDKFPGLTCPDPSYHGLVYAESFGRSAYIVKARAQLMRDYGAQMSPMNAFLLHSGLDTLALRMERHNQNGLALSQFLASHPKVSSVHYPFLDGDPYDSLAKRYLNGGSGVIAFEVKNGREGAARFMEGLKLASMAIHVADLRTIVLHPASTTHRQMSDQQLADAGIGPGLIRFSVGIEHIDDIIDDVEQALANA